MGLRSIHLFAGAGGGILADLLLGHTPVCAVEIEEYPRRVLLQRQLDGILPVFPIWDDVKTFDGTEWQGLADVVCGGFPCQDISAAGKGAGIDGERSGLWSEFARIIREVRPRFVFVENSPMLTSRGLHRVLGDLAEMGFDAEWGVLGADDAGAPHIRKRVWILADRDRQRELQPQGLLTDERGRAGDGGEGAQFVHTQRSRMEGAIWGRMDGTGIAAASGSELADAVRERGAPGVARPFARNEGNAGIPHDSRGQSGWWASDPADDAQSFVGRVADELGNRLDEFGADEHGDIR